MIRIDSAVKSLVDQEIARVLDDVRAFRHERHRNPELTWKEHDTAKAVAVCKRDSEVDQLNKQLYRELAGFMVENPANISRALELMFISKSLERIADHATNIAEEMIYLAHGKDVRHRPELK